MKQRTLAMMTGFEQYTRKTRRAIFLAGCGKSLNRDDSPPQGLKPSLILHDLRGAKAPLYHSAAGFRDFFRSLKSRALSRTFYESFTKFSVNLLLMIRAQQMPGLAIVLEARTFASALRIEAKAFAGREGLDGEHVPDIERDDVGDKNVNVVGGVNHLALPVDRVDGLDVVTAGAHDCGALELDAPEAASGGVVGVVVVRVVVVRIVAMRVVVMGIEAVRIEDEVV